VGSFPIRHQKGGDVYSNAPSNVPGERRNLARDGRAALIFSVHHAVPELTGHDPNA